MRTVKYEPAIFRRWHDGPVIVIDSYGVGSTIDTASAAYVAVGSNADVATYLNILRRPFAGTIYIVADESHVEWIAEEFPDLDIVHLSL